MERFDGGRSGSYTGRSRKQGEGGGWVSAAPYETGFPAAGPRAGQRPNGPLLNGTAGQNQNKHRLAVTVRVGEGAGELAFKGRPHP